MNTKDGGPAFPQPNQAHPGNPQPDNGPGMSLRDWFAGQALVALLPMCVHDTREPGVGLGQHIAEHAYELADSMLKTREESND